MAIRQPQHHRYAHAPVFVRITTAGIRESHVHDVSITKEAPTTACPEPWRAFHDLPKSHARGCRRGGAHTLTSTRTAS